MKTAIDAPKRRDLLTRTPIHENKTAEEFFISAFHFRGTAFGCEGMAMWCVEVAIWNEK